MNIMYHEISRKVLCYSAGLQIFVKEKEDEDG